MTDEERKNYRISLLKEDKIEQAGQNCRISLIKFFSMIPIKQERILTPGEINEVLMPFIRQGLTVTFLDVRYKVVDINFWRALRDSSWFHQGIGGLDYEYDFADCDNFAELARSIVSMFKKVNTLGRGSGHLVYNNTSTAHAYDIVLAIDTDGVIKPFLYDTEFKTEVVGLEGLNTKYNNCTWKTWLVQFS